ncbi:hypothetical protein [Rhodobacter sp. 24-YEA-8]|uniref:hypothetical protein n=1 Tax=Rhodobacter sp. 24-YEA-8 TaxID=1884310 RepID=UPI000B87810D|nr:hypothetical protein [Rhodobacter sp. 24-YEA-8]
MQLSDPDGGFMCWLQTARQDDLAVLSHLAEDISFLPGDFCRVRQDPDAGKNLCLALNFSFRWSSEAQAKLLRLLSALSG